MRNSRSEEHLRYYVNMVNCGVFSIWGEMRDCSMKDQKLYLISKQEQRVSLHLLTAIDLSERLEEFVGCMMKLRATLKTSLLLLLELKAYPVNCSTHILHVVVRFCKAKLALDSVRVRDNNFISTSEEKAYWVTFLWRDLDASATLLQVGKDLGIRSLIQVLQLVHAPACTTFLEPPTTNVSFEERRLLLSSSSLTSSLDLARARASGDQIVRTGYEASDDVVGLPFWNHPQCLPGFKLAGVAGLLFGSFTCHCRADVSVRNWGLPESPERVLTTLFAEEYGDENSSSSKSQGHVLSLSELMRLETVVETVYDADNLQPVVSKLSKKFDACLGSESCSTVSRKHAQTIKTHRLSKSWSYTAFSNQSPIVGATHTSARKQVRFQMSPEVDAAAEDTELPVKDSSSVSKMEHTDSVSPTGKPQETTKTTVTADANGNDEGFQHEHGIKRRTKHKLLSGLKAAGRFLGMGKRKNLRCTKSSKSTVSSPQQAQIALPH